MYVTKPLYRVLKFRVTKKNFVIYSLNPFVVYPHYKHVCERLYVYTTCTNTLINKIQNTQGIRWIHRIRLLQTGEESTAGHP